MPMIHSCQLRFDWKVAVGVREMANNFVSSDLGSHCCSVEARTVPCVMNKRTVIGFAVGSLQMRDCYFLQTMFC